MFSKLALLTLIAPFASALTLHTPAQLTPLALATLTWDTAPGDPELFTLEIVNEEFNDAFAIASNIDSDQGSIIVIIPVVPVRGGYTLEAVNVANTNDVYSQTGTFNVV
ncbi:hypothetical protein FA13DRAFT_1816293 [Coprinellus micaceus]|uniref:Yeast cell wall synthesis Kre9/Knh1-like N-terminal domain-containing protein n=1 Tax=Coprinellus micaceus TaxID=71717 RepID=A0A4Y7T0B4_COPMI|nr:hypothetical protein FA13DRAFT_1816293 [Coprinellus micaceus]